MKFTMLIRDEKEDDWEGTRRVNLAAFETPAEAKLVDSLRDRTQPLISLVAVEAETVVGHIMFSPVTLSDYSDLNLMGLAPMAVVPEQQNKGIGSALVRAGLERCKQYDVGAAVVLGHAEFYPRFGFSSAKLFGITSEYEVPDDVFMLVELTPDYLAGRTGTIKYHAAFSEL